MTKEKNHKRNSKTVCVAVRLLFIQKGGHLEKGCCELHFDIKFISVFQAEGKISGILIPLYQNGTENCCF